MIDSVLTWATDYKVDGFRFDLMGHQPKSSMIKIRRALDRLTLRRDGVDGTQDLPVRRGLELRRGGRTTPASCRPPSSRWPAPGSAPSTTGCATPYAAAGRSTRTRGSRASPAGSTPTRTGDPINGTPAEQLARLLLEPGPDQGRADRQPARLPVRRTGTGATVTGADVDYNGPPTGYTLDPQEVVTYVEAHDNETLFDALTYKLPAATTDGRPDPDADAGAVDHRARPGRVLLARRRRPAAQQVAGPQQLRLRRLVQRARLHLRRQRLRPRAAAEDRQRGQVAVHAPAAGRPGPRADAGRHPDGAAAGADALLEIRQSTPLFHLGSGRLVQQKVSFPGGGPEPDARGDRDADRRHGRPRRRPAAEGRWSWCSTPARRRPTQTVAGHGRPAVRRCTRCRPAAPTRWSRTSAYDRRAGSFTVPGSDGGGLRPAVAPHDLRGDAGCAWISGAETPPRTCAQRRCQRRCSSRSVGAAAVSGSCAGGVRSASRNSPR